MKNANITGRDGYILAKALAYAIVAINKLPQEAREESDMEDMRKILRYYLPDAAAMDQALLFAQGHLEGRPGGG